EDMGEPGALLRGEAGVLLVRAPVGEIDLLVRDVPVAAQDDLLLAIAQALQVPGEVLEEAQLRCLPVRAGGSRWHVDRDDPQVAEARLDVAAFGVELAAPEAAHDFVRGLAAVDGDAAIALLLRERMATLIELHAVEPRVEVCLLALHLLEAHDIRLLRGEPAKYALVGGRAHSVDVEGNYPNAF